MRRKATWLTLVALVVGACARGGPGDGELRVVPLDGEVFVVDGDDRTAVGDPRDVAPGSVVGTGEDGWARIVLPGAWVLELAPRSTLKVHTASSTELLTGRTLVSAPSEIQVASGEALVEGSGDFRLDRYVGALRLGVYSGAATVQGWDGRVSALEQVGIAAGIVPQAPVPLQVNPSDAWDSRKLGEAIDLGRELDDLQQGLKLQLEPDTPPAVLAGVLPAAFPAKASESRLRRAEPAEALVAAMVALQAAREEGTSALRALQQVLRLRGLGASWIIVVARWELYSRAILTALARVTGLVASVLIPVVASGATDTSPSGGGASGSTSTGTGSTSGAPSTGTGGSGGDGGSDPPTGGGGGDPGGGGDRPTCGSDVECAVDDVIGETGVGDDLDLP